LELKTGTIECFSHGKDGRLLQDWSNRRQVRNGYIYLGNTVVGLYEVNLTNGTVTPKYQHTDALGSPVATTNASKTVLSRMSYTPWPADAADGRGGVHRALHGRGHAADVHAAAVLRSAGGAVHVYRPSCGSRGWRQL
jgi:hypothetical protein